MRACCERRAAVCPRPHIETVLERRSVKCRERATLHLELSSATGVCGVTDLESSQMQPSLGAKPSLLAASTAAERDGRSESSSIRMLDAIGSKPRTGTKRPFAASTGWFFGALIAVSAVGGWWWLNRDVSTSIADGRSDTTAAPTTPNAMEPKARTTAVDAAPAPLATPASAGAATIEGPGIAVAAAAPARSGSSSGSGSGQGQASAPASSVAASISARATAAPRFETRTAVAGSARLAPPAAPALLDSAQRDAAGARDADVTLLTAMLARLSRNAADGQAAQSSATIGALLARCEARSTEDPAGAIKCRQELCADDRASLAACLTPPNGRAR